MRNRKLILVLILIAALAVVTGQSALAQQVTVKVWLHNHEPRVPVDRDNIARFEKENPDVKVDLVIIENADFDTRLATGLASAAGPDLFNQATFFMGQFYAQGILAPVDFEAIGVKDLNELYKQYGEPFMAGAVFGDKLYGLPTELSIYACFTNNKLWREAGLDPEKDFPKTWEDMVTVAEKLTKRDPGGAPIQRGFDFMYASIFMSLMFDAMVKQLGNDLIDEVNYTANLTSPEAMRVWKFWNDWVNTWKLGGPQYTETRSAFEAGELATNCAYGNWGVPLIEKAGIEYTIHPVPRFKDAKSDNGFATYAYFLMVNANAAPEVQKAAWKLASYLISDPQRFLDQAGLFIPAETLVNSAQFKENKIMPVFLQEMSKSKFSPRIAGYGEVNDALARARDRIFAGEDIESVAKEAEVEVNEILQRALSEARK